MRHDSAIELRDRWVGRARVTREAVAMHETVEEQPDIAVGIAGSGDDYRPAVRVRIMTPTAAQLVQQMSIEAGGELDVAVIGKVEGIAFPRVRPLVCGVSIGNRFGEAGTLGCFVVKKGTASPLMVLSNNHVIARLDRAKPNELIEQPSLHDQSGAGPFTIGLFGEAFPIAPSGNVVDAAIVPLATGIECDTRALFGTMDVLAGERLTSLIEKERVFKIGKKTGKTTGRIKAWGINDLTVTLGGKDFKFDDQIEILPDTAMFCDDGDSGAIVLDATNLAVGLLFSKSRTTEVSYANTIANVFDKLQVQLA